MCVPAKSKAQYMNDCLLVKVTDLKAVLRNSATAMTSKWLAIDLSNPHIS